MRASWETIRDEARVALARLGDELRGQIKPSWILPLVPEAEDRHVFTEDVYARARSLAPTTCERVGAIPYVKAFAFSRLMPGEHIPSHEHWNPYLTALLCLQGGAGCRILVRGERRDFVDGQYIVFDYTLPHEVFNDGDLERIVLLILIAKREALRS